MNQFKAGDTNAVVLAGMCTALAVVLSMVGFYVPGISLLALLSLPLPIAYMGIREGVKWAVIATSGIMILDSAFFGITTAFFLVVMFGFAGIAMAYCYQKRASALRTFGTIVVVMFFAMLLNLLGTVVMMGMPWDQVYGSTLDQMQGMAKEMSGLMASGDQLDQVNQQTEEMIKTIRKMIPAAMVMAPMVLAWAVMQIEKVVFRRLGLTDFPQFPPLERWHFPRWVLLLLLLSVGTQYMPLTEQVKDLAYNVGRGVLLRAVDPGDRDALVAAAYLSGGEAAASAHCHHFDLDPSPAALHGVSWRGRYGAELSEEERV